LGILTAAAQIAKQSFATPRAGRQLVYVSDNPMITNDVHRRWRQMPRRCSSYETLNTEQGWRNTREHSAGNPFPFTKRLRTYLTSEQNAVLASLPLLEPTIDSAIEGSLALARVFLPRARRLAAETKHPWPQSYEQASVSYFERSLGVQIGI
jgi:hypothetical protein